MQNPVQTLTANITKLNAKDQAIAADLLRRGKKWGFSPKQEAFVECLAKRAVSDEPIKVPEVVQIANMHKLVALFDHAAERLQYPAFTLDVPEVGEIQFKRESAKSPNAGGIKVAEDVKWPAKGKWYGRVNTLGQFTKGRDCTDPVVSVLQAFAADPVEVARAYGHKTGKCMFCAKKLTDERSTEAGFGKKCAQNYGLEW